MTDYEMISKLLHTAQGIALTAQGIALIYLGIDLIKLGRCLTKGNIYIPNNKTINHHLTQFHIEPDSKLEELSKGKNLN